MNYSESDWTNLQITAPATGVEFDWYALDRSGYLGVFSSAGSGAIPSKYWSFRREHCTLELRVDRLELKHQTISKSHANGDVSTWRKYAERGLFAFDFQDVHRIKPKNNYDLMFAPSSPIRAIDLLEAHPIAWLPRLDVCFDQIVEITIEKISSTRPS